MSFLVYDSVQIRTDRLDEIENIADINGIIFFVPTGVSEDEVKSIIVSGIEESPFKRDFKFPFPGWRNVSQFSKVKNVVNIPISFDHNTSTIKKVKVKIGMRSALLLEEVFLIYSAAFISFNKINDFLKKLMEQKKIQDFGIDFSSKKCVILTEKHKISLFLDSKTDRELSKVRIKNLVGEELVKVFEKKANEILEA